MGHPQFTMQTIFVISELYAPEADATGYFLTGIAEGLVTDSTSVFVLTAQPTYHDRGKRLSASEVRNGVSIQRVWCTTFDHRSIFGRLLNMLTFSFSIFWRSLLCLKSEDEVIVVTNPPTLPFLVKVAAYFKGASFNLLIHDVYPEVFTALRMLANGNPICRVINFMTRRLYESCTKIIVLGRDMKSLVSQKAGVADRMVIIENWGVASALPAPDRCNEDEAEPFVVTYCGNHGRTHNLRELIDAADALSEDGVFFKFIGEGSGKSDAMAYSKDLCLSNVSFEGRVTSDALESTLQSADLLVVAFKDGMSGVSVPSRMYNLMGSGRPILALTQFGSELDLVVRETNCGWSVSELNSLTQVILEAKNNPTECQLRGENGRLAVREKYSRETIIKKWRTLFGV